MEARGVLKIRLLGELQLVPGDRPAVTLPASRKTRALLGYLIATGQPHRRERLCDLFWDGPDDPRAELRWCLSKIRSLLKESGATLAADRQRVGIELGGAAIDLRFVRALLDDGIAAASAEALKQAAAQFGGEFLDGLDLPLCYRFQEWCMAEREALSRLRLDVLAALVERLHGQPDEALIHARALTVADPLHEAGHAAVVRLLARTGRSKEAAIHYARARRILESELGVAPSEALEDARRALRSAADAPIAVETVVRPSEGPAKEVRPASGGTFFAGRTAEQALIGRLVTASSKRRASGVVLVTGEAGIGKSHLLKCVAERAVAAGGYAWSGRCFEPEAVRPYGIWVDILQAIARGRSREELPAYLGVLLPEFGAAADPGDRGRLFDTVVELLRKVAAERVVAITLDDIQWIDEASSSLLHFVARHVDAASGLLIVCAARDGEIEDNAAASSVLRSLAREGGLQTIPLEPLGAEDTMSLAHSVDPALDATHIFARSEGNPLFTLELARAHGRGDADPGPTIGTLIAGQLARLTEPTRDVLLWAAAHGRSFTPDDLARAARLDAGELIKALGEMERRGVVRPAVGDDAYDFAHDLVRQTAYRSLSQPRRKLLHRHIARALEEPSRRDSALAADLAHHAAAADDHEVAASACAVAGERALRLFANVEAVGFAERGLRHVERLANDATKLEAQVALLKVRILAAAGPGMRPLPPLTETVAEAASAAETLGLPVAAATAHYLLSILHQEAGDTQRAQTSTLRAATAGRSADQATRARQLANTARCLLELESDIDRSRALIREGSAIVDPLGLELCELHWARGLLHRWDGEAELAVESLGRALALARKDEDRWREYKCLTWLAMLEQELGQFADMQARCAELRAVAARLGEDETPFVATLQALALLAAGGSSAADELADALRRLRAIDDKSYLAYALNSAARLHLQAGRIDQVRLCAAEALTAASAMRRKNEVTIAHALLAQAGEIIATAPGDWQKLSARARDIARVDGTGRTIPTDISTVTQANLKRNEGDE
jgi:DNA-binding SARP family transcriptional activator/tetratricopeptide (TPR) repeat protein